MVYGEHRNKIWWKIGWSCGSSANFLSKPEVPGKMDGPGKAGKSGGRNVPVVRILPRTETSGSWIWAEKLGERPKSEGENNKLEEKKGGEARSTSHTQNSRIKTNKISTHEQITKKIGAISGGDFRIRTKNNKIRLETQWGGSEIVINVALDTKMM